MGKSLRFRKNDYIYVEGAPSTRCYIKYEGQVLLSSKELFEKSLVGENEIFGLYSLVNGINYTESAIAQTDCEVWEMNAGDVLSLFFKDRDVREKTILRFIADLKVANKKVEEKAAYLNDNIPEEIFNGFLYYHNNNETEKANALFKRLEKHFKDSFYYTKALTYIKP